ncbi:MAG: hypothetical protein KME40_13490 [Komarekiella atlantica HA4396-MV6]|nr:hypothetical protein [Komarekiella atlantica HA4396-MV6]
MQWRWHKHLSEAIAAAMSYPQNRLYCNDRLIKTKSTQAQNCTHHASSSQN